MNIILLIISILIYLTYSIPGFIYLLFCVVTSFIGSQYLKRKNGKIILIVLITIYSLILILLKLSNLLTSNILIPLGISYYTLQIISYLVDTYKKEEPEKNFLTYALYIIYIPHLYIGPITNFNDIKKSLESKRHITLSNIIDGTLRISWGLFKKLLIANRISLIITTISTNPDTYSGCYSLLAMLLYSIMLYTDFSGGIDIVIGLTQIFDINLKENFNSPYQAETVQDFWRRWHISLGTWLKNYIYIPLGGNKCSKLRKNINTIITFLISGLWHGSNYLIWGLINGFLVILGDKYKTSNKHLNRIINYLIISLLWSFFIWDNNITAFKMLISIFTNFNLLEVAKNILELGLSQIEWFILTISVIILIILDIEKKDIISKLQECSYSSKLLLTLTLVLICLVFGIYGIGFNVTDFIYSKF